MTIQSELQQWTQKTRYRITFPQYDWKVLLCFEEHLVLICSGVNKAKDVQKIIESESYYRDMDGTEVSLGEELCGRTMRWKLKRMCLKIQ